MVRGWWFEMGWTFERDIEFEGGFVDCGKLQGVLSLHVVFFFLL